MGIVNFKNPPVQTIFLSPQLANYRLADRNTGPLTFAKQTKTFEARGVELKEKKEGI